MFRVLLFGLFITGALMFRARQLGKSKGSQTAAAVLAAVWLAASLGWIAGEWSGILAITMPSLILLIAGLLALPPFTLPVPPLPWKWPTVAALLYTLLWLLSLWAGWLDMNAIGLFAYLAGLLVVFRPAFPVENVQSLVASNLLVAYGVIVFLVWRWLQGFEMDNSLNVLVLIQGVLALSCYILPVTGKPKLWAWGLTALFGVAYLMMMFTGRITTTLTNALILPLGLVTFLRFASPDDEQATQWVELMSVLILVNYAMVWAVGLTLGELEINWLNGLVVGTGMVATLLPVLIKPSKNWKALKAIVTFNLGTNYPYSAIPLRELVTRAKGNPFGRLYAGPGIVLSNAEHAVVVHSGAGLRRISPPGVTFTNWAEEVQEIVDLRPQLRSMPPIVAKTKDGIDVKVVTFTLFRIATAGQEPELGRSFPYDENAVHRTVHAQRVDQEKRKAQRWDKLVRQTCEREMRDIIAAYTLDELSSLYDPSRDPRADIVARMKAKVGARVQEWGLELIGGGIGDLTPPQEVIDQRIAHWKAHWERRIRTLEAEADAEERRRLDIARAEAQMKMILRITEGLERLPTLDENRRKQLVALRLLEAIGRTASDYPVPPSQASLSVQWLGGFLGSASRDEPPAGEGR